LERVNRIMSKARAEAARRLSEGDWLWLVGTVLYWAEGSKPKEWRSSEQVTFTNMDPHMILIIREWLVRCCTISESDIVFAVQIHERADIRSALGYWAGLLDLPETDLRVHLKRHNPSPRRKNIGRTYYGTIRMAVKRSTGLNHRIAGWIQGLTTYCGVV